MPLGMDAGSILRDDRPFGGRAPPAAVFFYSVRCWWEKDDASGEISQPSTAQPPQQALCAQGDLAVGVDKADHVGLMPLHELIKAHVFAAEP
jgi:hypothetical protein